MKNDYDLNTVVELKKTHPCGCSKFRVVRVGVDIKIKCLACNRSIMMDRIEFDKKLKKVIGGENEQV